MRRTMLALAAATLTIPALPSTAIAHNSSYYNGKVWRDSDGRLRCKRPNGTTLSEITEATNWQPHSVRGFLSGVVKKKLKLKVESRKDDRERTYRIKGRTSS